MLGSLGGANASFGLGVSRDGTLVVGHTTNDSGGQAFLWDATNPQLGMQGLPNQFFPGGETVDENNAAYQVERAGDDIWVAGKTGSPQDGVTASIQAAIWKNGQPVYFYCPKPYSGT